MKNDHHSEKNEFCDEKDSQRLTEKDSQSVKKYIFRQLRSKYIFRQLLIEKKFGNEKKNFLIMEPTALMCL
jgi:hypothetical protein